MRVSSSSAIGGGQVSPARKAQLEKQIQKLEKQKRRLQKKLRGESTSSSQTQAPSFENAKVTMGSGGNKTVVPMGSSPSVVANTSAAASTTGDGSAAAALPKTTAPKPASATVSAVMEVISSFK